MKKTERMWGQESEGVGRAKMSEDREDKGDKVPIFFRSLISHPHLHSLYLSRTFPHPPTQLHCRIRL